MINPYYFTDENLKIRFKINLDSHKNNDADSILFIIPIYIDIGIENRCIIEILKQLATIYARSINQYKFKHHILFSVSFYKVVDEDQRSDDMELFINLNIIQSLTESGIQKQ